MAVVPDLALNNGRAIPQVGFGVFKVPPQDTQRIVEQAIEVGYRHLDTATGYDNEREVGAAVRASGVAREELFVTTKLRNDHHREGDVEGAFRRSLDALDTGWIDLYLIHWPMPAVDRYVETWRTFERFAAEGSARSIGVSNFTVAHLERLLAETDVVPTVNQVELHPIFQQRALREFHGRHGIRTEAWGPLGQGKYDVFGLQPIQDAAEVHEVTPAQVVLRWHVQHDIVVIPKSSSRGRMQANFDLFGFELTADEIAAIDALDEQRRVGGDPDSVNQ